MESSRDGAVRPDSPYAIGYFVHIAPYTSNPPISAASQRSRTKSLRRSCCRCDWQPSRSGFRLLSGTTWWVLGALVPDAPDAVSLCLLFQVPSRQTDMELSRSSLSLSLSLSLSFRPLPVYRLCRQTHRSLATVDCRPPSAKPYLSCLSGDDGTSWSGCHSIQSSNGCWLAGCSCHHLSLASVYSRC